MADLDTIKADIKKAVAPEIAGYLVAVKGQVTAGREQSAAFSAFKEVWKRDNPDKSDLDMHNDYRFNMATKDWQNIDPTYKRYAEALKAVEAADQKFHAAVTPLWDKLAAEIKARGYEVTDFRDDKTLGGILPRTPEGNILRAEVGEEIHQTVRLAAEFTKVEENLEKGGVPNGPNRDKEFKNSERQGGRY